MKTTKEEVVLTLRMYNRYSESTSWHSCLCKRTADIISSGFPRMRLDLTSREVKLSPHARALFNTHLTWIKEGANKYGEYPGEETEKPSSSSTATGKWTKKETDIIADKYPDGGTKGCMKACMEAGIYRTKVAITRKATAMGLHRDRSSAHWSTEELEILREKYPSEGSPGCRKAGINRDWRTICAKAFRLKIARDV